MKMPTWSKKTKIITLVCTFVVALAVTLISRAPANPQAGPWARRVGVPNANAQPQALDSAKDPRPLTLWGTFFDTSTEAKTPLCLGADCSAFEPVFQEEIVCPVEEGESCTFQITIQSENLPAISNEVPPSHGESGDYRFKVDGAPPSPGPVGYNAWICPGCYEFSYNFYPPPPDESLSSSAAVTAKVTNTEDHQKHSVEVDVGCIEFWGDGKGCETIFDAGNLQVAVYTKSPEPF